VIIHENRFTYKDKGLEKVTDLGNYWETKTGKPIPLGGIVIDKKMDPDKQNQINGLIKESIGFAYKSYPDLPGFVTENAQEMGEGIMRQHIDLYVNKFSLSLGIEGRDAVQSLLDVYANMHPDKEMMKPVFVPGSR
jgi:1,4-dihydroxy-6-naphthoate synthase